MTCIVVGAGMSGITAATALQKAGWRVTVLDKGRGLGGRMATRRIGDSRFDHGAQFFTVRDPDFARAVSYWLEQKWARPWFQERHTRYRAEGGMSALAKNLAQGLAVETGKKVVRLHAENRIWQVTTEDESVRTAALLILTLPAPQALELLSPAAIPGDARAQLESIQYDPCLALLVDASGATAVPESGYVRPSAGPFAWIANNQAKGLSEQAALTFHATAAFSREYLENPAEAEIILRREAEQWYDSPAVAIQFHRWRYSIPTVVHTARCLTITEPAPLVLAGDGFGEPRVEGAFLSGSAAAEAADALRESD